MSEWANLRRPTYGSRHSNNWRIGLPSLGPIFAAPPSIAALLWRQTENIGGRCFENCSATHFPSTAWPPHHSSSRRIVSPPPPTPTPTPPSARVGCPAPAQGGVLWPAASCPNSGRGRSSVGVRGFMAFFPGFPRAVYRWRHQRSSCRHSCLVGGSVRVSALALALDAMHRPHRPHVRTPTSFLSPCPMRATSS